MVDYITNYPHCQLPGAAGSAEAMTVSPPNQADLLDNLKNQHKKRQYPVLRKQLRHPWTDEEHKLFVGALTDHGPR